MQIIRAKNKNGDTQYEFDCFKDKALFNALKSLVEDGIDKIEIERNNYLSVTIVRVKNLQSEMTLRFKSLPLSFDILNKKIIEKQLRVIAQQLDIL